MNVNNERARSGIVDVFTYRNKLCVIIHMTRFDDFHNGYVEVEKHNNEKDYDDLVSDIETDELTFSGRLIDERIPPDKWFFGFDSCHYWNDENPETKTFRSVKERTKQLADEFIEKGI